MNELIILLSVVVYFGGVVLFYKMFGKLGLYGWTVLMTILANIEALILVNAFGLEMTLGNVAFASTFLVTDVLAEKYGRKAANTAVKMGILSSSSPYTSSCISWCGGYFVVWAQFCWFC